MVAGDSGSWPLGGSGTGLALVLRLVPFVPGDQALDRTSLVFPDGTSQHGQSDDAGNYSCLEARISQKTGHRTQPNPQQDNSIVIVILRYLRLLRCYEGICRDHGPWRPVDVAP